MLAKQSLHVLTVLMTQLTHKPRAEQLLHKLEVSCRMGC